MEELEEQVEQLYIRLMEYSGPEQIDEWGKKDIALLMEFAEKIKKAERQRCWKIANKRAGKHYLHSALEQQASAIAGEIAGKL